MSALEPRTWPWEQSDIPAIRLQGALWNAEIPSLLTGHDNQFDELVSQIYIDESDHKGLSVVVCHIMDHIQCTGSGGCHPVKIPAQEHSGGPLLPHCQTWGNFPPHTRGGFPPPVTKVTGHDVIAVLLSSDTRRQAFQKDGFQMDLSRT
ncbi:hypothetical protein Bbelb_274940 [Branchiostoma belcheri]|nr:hypothetical protein Bbelb_274940 [Branchiostoma belcheri]